MTHELVAADDELHPAPDDPWWTETVWFSWNVPEHGIVGYVYPVFRPNLGIQFGGVVVMGGQSAPPWEEPVHHFDWHQPMPPDLDLRDMRLANGLHVQVIEPGRSYAIGYSGRDLELSISAEAVGPALVTRSNTPPLGAGHIDQMCRVQGHMNIGGDDIAIDCLAIRDRAWGSRPDGRQPRVFYDWAAADDDSYFLAAGIHRDGVDLVSTGFRMSQGVWSPIISGLRQVDRDDQGQVRTVHIEATDQLGRTITADGTAQSRHLFGGYPSMLCWTGLVAWTFDGISGWGEDQDVWSPRRWREHRRATTLRP